MFDLSQKETIAFLTLTYAFTGSPVTFSIPKISFFMAQTRGITVNDEEKTVTGTLVRVGDTEVFVTETHEEVLAALFPNN